MDRFRGFSTISRVDHGQVDIPQEAFPAILEIR